MYRVIALNPTSRSILYLVFSILFLAFFAGKAFAQGSQAQIVLTPDKQSVSSGQNLNVVVKLDTAGTPVNTFTASLDYPQDKLEFVSIDSSKSPFKLELESAGANGNVKMTRGAVDAQTGQVLAGTVTFKAKGQVSADDITISNDSAIISSDNNNILQGSTVQKGKPADGAQAGGNFLTKLINSIKTLLGSLFKQ